MWLSKPPAGIQLNRNHPLAQGLVGCWLFNEGAGLRVNDLTGNGNNGILTNFEPMSATSGWIGTNSGTGLIFNGTTCSTNVSNPTTLTFPNGLTIESIINTKSLVVNEIARRDGDVTTHGWYILRINGNKLNFQLLNHNLLNLSDLNSTHTITTNTYYHVVGVTNRTTMYIYVNGILDGSTTDNTTDPLGISNFTIGSNPGGGELFNGIISYVRIWNRALNSTEVQQLYAQPYAMFWNPSERIRKNYDNEILI